MNKLDFDIMMLALPRWDGLYSSTAYSLAKALSQHTRVFYIDNPFTYKDFLNQRNTKQIQKRKKALLSGKDIFTTPDAQYPNLIAVTPRLVFPINWLPKGVIYNALSRVNDALLGQALQATCQAYNIRRFIFINSFNPLFGKYLPKSFSPDITIYHCVDDISKSAYIANHGTYREAEAAAQADFTLVTSMELKRLKTAQTRKPVFYLPNAANVELFQQAVHRDLEKPVELMPVAAGRKIITYLGNICQRLDYELLKKIATQYADCILLMIGPQSNENYKKAGLDKLSNVIFTGSKPLDEIPAYLKYSHCCIIPFLCIPLTKSIYPLKINEYLSAGKPVITTDFSEDIANFGSVAYVSSSHDQFLENLGKAMADDTAEKVRQRVAYAATNNWQARASELIEIINRVEK